MSPARARVNHGTWPEPSGSLARICFLSDHFDFFDRQTKQGGIRCSGQRVTSPAECEDSRLGDIVVDEGVVFFYPYLVRRNTQAVEIEPQIARLAREDPNRNTVYADLLRPGGNGEHDGCGGFTPSKGVPEGLLFLRMKASGVQRENFIPRRSVAGLLQTLDRWALIGDHCKPLISDQGRYVF